MSSRKGNACRSADSSVGKDAWTEFRADLYQRHEVYEGKSLLVQYLDILGHLHFKKGLPNALNPGRHENAFEVFLMVEGRVDWWINDEHFVLKGGEAIIVRGGALKRSQ